MDIQSKGKVTDKWLNISNRITQYNDFNNMELIDERKARRNQHNRNISMGAFSYLTCKTLIFWNVNRAVTRSSRQACLHYVEALDVLFCYYNVNNYNSNRFYQRLIILKDWLKTHSWKNEKFLALTIRW